MACRFCTMTRTAFNKLKEVARERRERLINPKPAKPATKRAAANKRASKSTDGSTAQSDADAGRNDG